ncbi:MAG TPA: TIGR02391 family protein, partial [Anaerolineales bacterium]|nr:TIGR02391 family protein [Anaerolineales bacterium]
ENLLQINSLDDVDRFVLYRDGELFQNDLLDIWADKLQLALHQLYYQLSGHLDNQTLYPFWDKFPSTITYYRVVENPQSAIQQAFIFFGNYLRKRIGAGSELFGEELINKAFGKNGKLIYRKIPAEQNGARNLLSGAYATFRNPNMHRLTDNDEKGVLAILSVIFTMFDIVKKF